jgi:transcriptional regulator with XRE-family HTH domain
MDNLVKIATILSTRREKLGITQFELAEMVGLSDLTIRNIEKGKTGTSVGNFINVANRLGYNLELTIKRMSDEDRRSL